MLIEHRLRIRNASDSADLFTASTIRGNADAYLEAPPSADGNEFDVFTGACRCGAYVYRVLDVITSGTDRVVTSLLEDAAARTQFIGLKAYGEWRQDGGSWNTAIPGYVSLAQLPSALPWEFTISDPTRMQNAQQAFAPRRGVVTLTAPIALHDTALSCAPLTLGLVAGTQLNFGAAGASARVVTLTADAHASDTTIAIASAPIAVSANAQAAYAESIASYMARWPNRGCILGGPITGGFAEGKLPDLGGWTMEIADSEFGGHDRVYLKFIDGYDVATGWRRTRDARLVNAAANDAVRPRHRTSGGSVLSIGRAQAYTVDDAQDGNWPGLVAEVRALDNTLIGYFNPRDADGWVGTDGLDAPVDAALINELVINARRPGIFIYAPSLSITHAHVKVRVFSVLPDPLSALYLDAHPVDLLDKLWTEARIPHDASDTASLPRKPWSDARAAIGADARIALRITATTPLGDLITNTLGARGIGLRPGDDGLLEPFAMGVFPNTPPSRTITDADVINATTQPFILDEQTALRTVTIQQQRLVLVTAPDPRYPDGLVPADETAVRTNADPGAAGTVDVNFTLPGMIHHAGSWDSGLVAYADAFAQQLFDRGGRGLVVATTTLLRGGAGDGALLGDEMLFALPQTPNHNKRLGDDGSVAARAMQIVRSTNTTRGAEVKLADSGPNAQPVATVPVLTLAPSSDDPRTIMTATITNAATLNAAGIAVRLQLASASGMSPASTAYADALYFPAGLVPTGAFALPPMVAGRTIGVRARSELSGSRPSNWSTPVTHTLDAVPAPTSASVAPNLGDGSQALVRFTAGADDVLTELHVRLATTDASLATRVIVLPPGSDAYLLDGLTPGAAYVLTLTSRDPSTRDTSASVEVDFTAASATATLVSPADPTPFAGAQDAIYGLVDQDGLYGLAVTAIEVPGLVEVYEALETAVGSGVFGTAVSVGVVASVPHAWTLWSSVAPRDRLQRQLTARHVGDGQTASDFTDAVTVTPWQAQRLADYGTTQSATNLIDFAITDDTPTTQVRGWTWGARVARIGVYQWLVPVTTTQAPVPSPGQWPDFWIYPGTNAITLTKPPAGMRLWTRLETRLDDAQLTVGQVRTFSIDPPGAYAATFARAVAGGTATLSVMITDPAGLLDPVTPIQFRVTRDNVSSIVSPTTHPATGTSGTYTRDEAVADKHVVEIEPLANLADGTQQHLGAFTFDSNGVADVVSLTGGFALDQFTANARFDADTSTAQYRIDGGSPSALAVAGDLTASLTETMDPAAAHLLEVRGVTAAGDPGPWSAIQIPQLSPTQLTVTLTQIAADDTTVTLRATVNDPIPQAGSAYTLTPSVSSSSVSPSTPQTCANGGHVDFVVTKSAVGAAPVRFTITASASGRVSATDAADVGSRDGGVSLSGVVPKYIDAHHFTVDCTRSGFPTGTLFNIDWSVDGLESGNSDAHVDGDFAVSITTSGAMSTTPSGRVRVDAIVDGVLYATKAKNGAFAT